MAVATEEVVGTYPPPVVPDNLEAVFIVSKKGVKVIDAVIARPSPVFNTEKVVKGATMISVIADSIAKELGEEGHEEVRIETKGRVILLINDGDYVRVGIAVKE